MHHRMMQEDSGSQGNRAGEMNLNPMDEGRRRRDQDSASKSGARFCVRVSLRKSPVFLVKAMTAHNLLMLSWCPGFA